MPFSAMRDREIAAVRPDGGAAGRLRRRRGWRPVRLRNRSSAASAGIVSRASPRPSPSSARRGRGNGPIGLGAGRGRAVRPASRRAAAIATPLSAIISSRAASQAGSCRRLSAQQPRALAQRMFIGGDARRHAPGREPKTSRSRNRRRPAAALDEQPIHLRGQPDHRDELGERGPGRVPGFAVDAHDAALSRPPLARSRVAAGADARPARGEVDASPQPPTSLQATFAGCGADRPQPSGALRNPRPGDRKDTASSRLVLPAPLGPVSTTGAAIGSSRRRAVAAEIGQSEPGHTDPLAGAREVSLPACCGDRRIASTASHRLSYGVESLDRRRASTSPQPAALTIAQTRIGIST